MSFSTSPADQQALDTFAGQTSGYYPTQLAQQLAMFQQQQAEAQREFNLNYTNQVGQTYGNNFGLGQPAPSYVPTLASQQATGGIGYIPNVTGFTDQQSLEAQNQYYNQALAAAGQTGFFGAPASPAAPVGSWVTADGGAQYGTQYGIVLPSGQIQRVGLADAVNMGFKPGQTPTTQMDLGTFVEQGQAPPGPTSISQTMAGQQNQSQLASNAINQALAASQATGMYQAPSLTPPAGMDYTGQMFTSLPQSVQQQYLNVNRGDINAAMAQWVTDSNNAISQAAQAAGAPAPTYQGIYGPQQAATETQAAQQQYFNEAQMLAQMYGQAYAPGSPTSAAGGPAPGQQTLAAQQQYFNEQQQQANLGLQYLQAASQLQGPQNTFQLSNFMRGAQGNPNVPVFLQALANNNASQALPAFQGTGSTAPTPLSMSTLAGGLTGGSTSSGGLLGAGTGGSNQGFDPTQSLNTIAGIANAGAGKLAPGTLERLTPDELQAFGSGLGAVGNSLPSFLQAYQNSRPQQSAMTGDVGLAA